MSHGEDRDSVHMFGGIAHHHGEAIDLNHPNWKPRKHLPGEN